MIFLEYPPCSTCRKARKWLEERNVAFTARHIKEDNPTAGELQQWAERSGLPLKRFFNTSGMLYRSSHLKERLPDMSEEAQLSLLATDGMLVKRPILVLEDTVLVGFRESQWESVLFPQK